MVSKFLIGIDQNILANQTSGYFILALSREQLGQSGFKG